MVDKTKRRKAVPIVIPNEHLLEPEEVERQKHAEKQRRHMARLRGKEPGDRKMTGQEIRKMETNEMITMAKDTRNLTIQVLYKKLEELSIDPEALSKVNLATLATTFGILFDKAQLMDGMATQNIAIHAKIDVNMSADKAMEELNKMRESYTEDNK